MRVGLIQLDINKNDKISNIKKAIEYVEILKNCNLICLPEEFVSGFNYSLFNQPYRYINQVINPFQKKAKKYKIYIVLGSFLIKRNKHLLDFKSYNSCIVLGPDGKVCGIHKKINLHEREKKWVVPGNNVTIYKINGFNFITLINHDIYLPEIRRILKNDNINLIILPCFIKNKRYKMPNIYDICQKLARKYDIYIATVFPAFTFYTSVFCPDGNIIKCKTQEETTLIYEFPIYIKLNNKCRAKTINLKKLG